MNTRSSTAAGDLLQRLTPLISGETASIGALDTATQHEDDPGYVVLYRIAKTEKQASVQQMVSLLRMVGESPREAVGSRSPS